jgi:hypothetical protein
MSETWAGKRFKCFLEIAYIKCCIWIHMLHMYCTCTAPVSVAGMPLKGKGCLPCLYAWCTSNSHSFLVHSSPLYEGVSKSFRTELITKQNNTRWEATQRVMPAKLTKQPYNCTYWKRAVSTAVLTPGGQSRNFWLHPHMSTWPPCCLPTMYSWYITFKGSSLGTHTGNHWNVPHSGFLDFVHHLIFYI